MTAAEWDTSVMPSRMLRAYPVAWDRRKVWLFWCACMRRALFSAADARVRLLAALIENDPAGRSPRLVAEVAAARQRLRPDGPTDQPEYWSLGVFADPPPRPLVALLGTLAGAVGDWEADRASIEPRTSFWLQFRNDAESDEQARQCDLIREVFGNPFRSTEFSPWRTDTVLGMARDLYDHREYSGMPILADALQDAGCEDEHVLSHCRDDREHVRGCWVLDGLLGQ